MMDLGPEAEPQQETDRERDRKLAALEAVLFMAAEPLSRDELAEILEVEAEEATALVETLAAACDGRGLQVSRIAGGYQLVTRPEYGPHVAKLHKPERFRLSRAALETLAIVAYKQPVTRPEIEAIRGVNSDSPIDTLHQYRLLSEAGRKDAPGRPVLYRTTENFLGHFGLDSIDDLPQLDAIPSDDTGARAEAAKMLGGDEGPTASPEGEPEAAKTLGGDEGPAAPPEGEPEAAQEPSAE